jgi:hypothetical protein
MDKELKPWELCALRVMIYLYILKSILILACYIIILIGKFYEFCAT